MAEVIPEPPAPKPTDEPLMMAQVEKRPEFTGGDVALSAFLSQHLKYPAVAMENGIAGRVIVSFIVEKDGSLTNAQIIRDIGGGCGQEALRLIQAMPKWVPGQQNGQLVRVKYTLLVAFSLD